MVQGIAKDLCCQRVTILRSTPSSAFGGAGSQHACAMALRTWGSRNVLIPSLRWNSQRPTGSEIADVRRFSERSSSDIVFVWSGSLPASWLLPPVVDELADRGTRSKVEAEGIEPEDRKSLAGGSKFGFAISGCRINDQCCCRTEPMADWLEVLTKNRSSKNDYGYCHSDRGLEIVAARVEVVGTTPDARQTSHYRNWWIDIPTPDELVANVWIEGEAFADAESLNERINSWIQEIRLEGPAIVCEPTSTVVIEPGFLCHDSWAWRNCDFG